MVRSNPTQDRPEEALAASEGGEAALFFASGLAACAALLQTLPAGSHVIHPHDVYHGVREMAHDFLPRWGATTTAVVSIDTPRPAPATHPASLLRAASRYGVTSVVSPQDATPKVSGTYLDQIQDTPAGRPAAGRLRPAGDGAGTHVHSRGR